MKNWIIVLLIFVIPLGLYAYLDNRATADSCSVTGSATSTPKAKIIKFSSPMCSECQEVAVEIKKAMENYKDFVIIEEYNVLDSYNKEKNATKDMIKKHKISLVPTLIFMDKEGKTIKKEGMIKSEEITKILDKIKW